MFEQYSLYTVMGVCQTYEVLFSTIALDLLGIAILSCCAAVIFSRSLIFSLLSLALVFLFVSILFLVLKAELIALVTVTIYMGAIVVLFLFAVMMLEYKIIDLTRNSMRHLLMFYIIFSFLWLSYFPALIENYLYLSLKESCLRIQIEYFDYKGFFTYDPFLFYILDGPTETTYENRLYNDWIDSGVLMNDVLVYGQVLYSYFVVPLILTGTCLLLASIGAVHFSKRFINKSDSVTLRTQQEDLKQLARAD